MAAVRRTDLSHPRLADLSTSAVRDYREKVMENYPGAQWTTDQNFGRIVAGDRLLSLRFSLIDPQASDMGWWDAAQRLGTPRGHKDSAWVEHVSHDDNEE